METKTMLSPFIRNHQSYQMHSNYIITIFPPILMVDIFGLNLTFSRHYAPGFDK